MTVVDLLLTKREGMDIKFNIEGYVFDTLYKSTNEILDDLTIMGLGDNIIDQIEITDLYTLEAYSFK